jgi:drug/metabolite transporter (DMT)-like permease
VLEHFVTRGHRLTRQKSLGLGLAAAGVLLILSAADSPANERAADAPTRWGDLILVLSAFVLGLKILYVKQALRIVEPGKLIFWHDLVGVVLFALCSLLFEPLSNGGWTLPAVLSILYQGVLVAGLCFVIQAHLLRRHSASQISVFNFAAPLFGVSLAILLRGDPLSPWLLVSVACVVAGIWLVQQE